MDIVYSSYLDRIMAKREMLIPGVRDIKIVIK
jgi:hypothetical protein